MAYRFSLISFQMTLQLFCNRYILTLIDAVFSSKSFAIFVNYQLTICCFDTMLIFRLAYSLQHADCAGAVFYSVMKSALVAAQSTNGKLFIDVRNIMNPC